MSQPRAANWPSLLASYVEARRTKPFAWGFNDCCLFAADWVREATGEDPAADLRGYTTALGAVRRIRRHGDSVESLPGELGFEEIPKELAQRGDVVSVPMPGGLALAVCAGSNAVGPGLNGIVGVPMSEARRAWRV